MNSSSQYTEKWSVTNFEPRNRGPRSELLTRDYSLPVVTLTIITCLDVQQKRALKRAVLEAMIDDTDMSDAFKFLFSPLSYIFPCINDWFVRRIWYEIYVMTNNQNQFSEQSPLFFSKECTGLKLGMYLIAKVGSNLI